MIISRLARDSTARRTYLSWTAGCLAIALSCISCERVNAHDDEPCHIRLSDEDYDDLLTRTTSVDQRKLLAQIEANDAEGAIATISRLHTADFWLPNRETLLSVAVGQSNPLIVKALLDAGADPNRKDCDGFPALYYLEASWRSLDDKSVVEIADLLVAHGATIVGEHNKLWRSHLLWLAANYGHPHLIKWLLEHGAHIDDEYGGATALSGAIAGERIESARFLIENGARMDPKDADPTLLIKAIQLGDPALVRLLVEHGASVNAHGAMGYPLNIAQRNLVRDRTSVRARQDEEIVAILVAAGAKTNQ